MPYAANDRQQQGVSKGSVKCWVCMLVVFVIISLGLLLTAFLTSNHVIVKYTISGSSEVSRSRYGIWTSCMKTGTADEVCQATKGYGPPFDVVHSQIIVILYMASVCLFLPSVVGLIITSVRPGACLLASLVFVTVFGSFGTLVAALGLFTWKVEHDLVGARTLGSWTLTQTGVAVTYWWSYMLGWIAAGVLLIVLLNMMVLLCCQRRIRDEEAAEAKTQIRERDENGVYNPSYKADSSKRAKRASGYPVVIGQQNAFQTEVPPFESHTTRASDYDSPASSSRASPLDVQLEEHMFYRPNATSNELFKQQETIELRPRVVHQPTPFMNNIRSDDDRTYTVSQVIPASSEESGYKLDVGDTYLVSLNQQDKGSEITVLY